MTLLKGASEKLREELNHREQEIQRGAMKIEHLENDTRIMNGKIEQLRADCRQQEKNKKDLAEQLRFQEISFEFILFFIKHINYYFFALNDQIFKNFVKTNLSINHRKIYFETRSKEQRNDNDQHRINELQQQLEAASDEQLSSKKNSQELHRLRGELDEARAKHAQQQLDQQQVFSFFEKSRKILRIKRFKKKS